MATNYEEVPTFLGHSEEPVSVIAGCALSGYGGVMLHEPTDYTFRSISFDAESDITPKGAGFNYNEVATITVSGLLRWTNLNLERAPQGRQDVNETGPIRIELFDTEEAREYIEDMAKIFEKLGIKFIG